MVLILVGSMALLLLSQTQAEEPVVDPAWEQIVLEWQDSAHAQAEVNCSSCHQHEETQSLVPHPGGESCQSCHEQEMDTFLLGKHGIRLLEGQSPLTPAMARLPMKESAHSLELSCQSCHQPHSVNTVTAAVDSCLGCHNDTHSLNYWDSPHGIQFAKEVDQGLPRPSGNAVSCATCHLPRYEEGRGEQVEVFVNHNNTYTLKPRDRMVKDVCMHCHGMEFSYNSIFSDELIDNNFSHAPEQELETLAMARTQREIRESRPRSK
jgi:hypothetical protein